MGGTLSVIGIRNVSVRPSYVNVVSSFTDFRFDCISTPRE